MRKVMSANEKLAGHSDAVAKSGRRIQEEVDQKDKSSASGWKMDKPMPAGQRDCPAGFPNQHLEKPGIEGQLEVKPMYEAPDYKGSGKLQDKVALITGGDSGIGRAVAVL